MTAYLRTTMEGNENWTKQCTASAFGIASGVTVALKEAVKISEGQLNAAVLSMSGDMHLSNYPREGNNRAVRAKGGVKNQAKGVGEAAIGPKGPVVIVENDTNAHMIGFGKASKARSRVMGFQNGAGGVFSGYSINKVTTAYGGKSSTHKRLNINGRWVMGPVRHPGTSGKNRWKQTRDGPLKQSLRIAMRAPITKGAMSPWGR